VRYIVVWKNSIFLLTTKTRRKIHRSQLTIHHYKK
jgi:hypothetical protein